jgi:hypothetical protein
VRAIATVYFFLLHAWFETTALNHEAIDHAMKNRAVIVAGFHVRQKIFDGFRCLVGVEFNRDLTVIGAEYN